MMTLAQPMIGEPEVSNTASALAVKQRMIDAMPVSVAVDEQNLPRKPQCFSKQGFQKLTVSTVTKAGRKVVEPGVGLHDDDDPSGVLLPGDGKALLEPFDQERIPHQKLRAGLLAHAEIVVGAGDVE